MLYAPALIARWFEHNSNARPAERASAACSRQALSPTLSFFPPKIRYFKKSFICTIVVSRQIHVLTDTRMLRTILGRTFMAATLQHSTLLPGNGSVCDSITVLEFHKLKTITIQKNHYYSRSSLIAPCLIRSTCLTFSRCENSGPVQSVLYYYTAPSHTPTACFSTARFNIEFIARVPQIMYTKHCFPLKIELHA